LRDACSASLTTDRRDIVVRIGILACAIALTVTFTGSITITEAASDVITHGSHSRPWVALTFDDGWYANRYARIANTLRAKGVTATFLINGAIIRRDIRRWWWILRGFPIANHTLSHRDLTHERNAEIRKQIAANEQAIEGALGRPILKLLRPSYGAYDGDVIRIADSLGYRTLTWTIDSRDTKPGATTRSVIRDGSAGGRGAIVLLHCGPSMTPAVVGPIIERYRRRGFRLRGPR
jgi:peptidoglycan/xylan/chitin deacetylase (PgdA/CDA1 family)